MSTLTFLVFFISGVVVIIEALNKCERARLFDRTMNLRFRLVEIMKAVGWGLLAIGAYRAVLDSITAPDELDLNHGLLVVGLATLIIRRRIKELRNDALRRLV